MKKVAIFAAMMAVAGASQATSLDTYLQYTLDAASPWYAQAKVSNTWASGVNASMTAKLDSVADMSDFLVADKGEVAVGYSTSAKLANDMTIKPAITFTLKPTTTSLKPAVTLSKGMFTFGLSHEVITVGNDKTALSAAIKAPAGALTVDAKYTFTAIADADDQHQVEIAPSYKMGSTTLKYSLTYKNVVGGDTTIDHYVSADFAKLLGPNTSPYVRFDLKDDGTKSARGGLKISF